jgi:KaiC/GvpD/RAD55 family RecA-like ATPase
MPIVIALFVVLIGSSIGGAWFGIRRSHIKKTRPEAPVAAPPIVVPKIVLPGRVPTGSEDLDNLLHGGIPQGYSVALTSPSCDERGSLIKRFLEVGAKKGDVTFYVTIDPGELTSLAEEQPNFYLFVCNPQADAIVRSSSNVFKLKGVENLTEISIVLTSAIRRLDPSLRGSRRICIGLISDILLQHQTVQTRRWLAGLIPELRSAGFTTLAVLDPEMHASQETRAILDLFEGEINITEINTGKGPLKFIKVKKMTSQEYSEQESILRKESLEPQNTTKGNEPE